MTWFQRNLVWIGVAFAAAAWFAEAMLDAWVFGLGSLAERLFPPDPHDLWMRSVVAVVLIVFGVFAHAVAVSLHRAAVERHALERKLSQALAHVLGDFIPICAQCNSVREDGSWLRIEEYVTGHTGSQFTHGLCPNCVKDVEAELRASPPATVARPARG